MREQLPLMSLAIAAMAFLIALYPPGTFWRHRTRQTLSHPSNMQNPAIIQNSGGNSSDTDVVKLQEEVRSLSRKMDRLSQDYQALSEWTMEQLVAIEASKNSSQWDDDSDNYQDDSYSDEYIDDPGRYADNDTHNSQRAQVSSDDSASPANERGVWPQNQFQSTIAALSLFPQQVEPARKVFDDGIRESREKIGALKSQGIISSESLAQIRVEVRATMEEKLSSILTSDQMDDFVALNSRTNRYDSSKGGQDNTSVTGTGSSNTVSRQGVGTANGSTQQVNNPSQTTHLSTGEMVSTTR